MSNVKKRKRIHNYIGIGIIIIVFLVLMSILNLPNYFWYSTTVITIIGIIQIEWNYRMRP